MSEPLVSKGGGASDVHDWQPIAPVALPPGEIVSEWPSSKVSAWLTALGLSGYAPSFAEHRITGDVLEVLTEAHLVQLGVELIGHRVLLMREIQSLRRAAVNRQRFRVLWEAKSIMYHRGLFDWCYQVACCVPCCDEADHYKLTASTLVSIHRDHTKKLRVCCPTAKLTRQIDLTSVVGASAMHSSRVCDCGCAADQVVVDLNGEHGLAELPPLLVAKGSGAEIAQQILGAMEEAQANEFGGVAPRSQAIARY